MIIRQSYKFGAAVALISLFFLFPVLNIELYSIIGISLFLFFVTKFYFDLGVTVDIRDIMILFAFLQWVIGPVLSYHLIEDNPIFYMSVDEKTYMGYIVPAVSLFALGLYVPFFPKKNNEHTQLYQLQLLTQKYPNLDLLLLISGIILIRFWEPAPQFLKFFIYLLSNIRFVGIFLLFIRNRPYKWLFFGAFMLSMLAGSVQSALFHDLVLWLGFSIIIISFVRKFSIVQKSLMLAGALSIVVMIQVAKPFIRRLSASERNITTFYETADTKINEENILQEQGWINYNISRINQGWIISRIMYNVPTFEPFANGETIWVGIKGSLLPRFIAPDIRTQAGNSAYFERFTGQKLARRTSMDISIVGEAYANYGVTGGAIFMFFLGLFFNFILHYIINLSLKHPILLLMIPFMFLHAVKAETDFTSTMNYLVKSIFTVIAFFIGMRRVLGYYI